MVFLSAELVCLNNFRKCLCSLMSLIMLLLTRSGLLLTSADTPKGLAQETLYFSGGIGRLLEDSFPRSNNLLQTREHLCRLFGTPLLCPGINADPMYPLAIPLSNYSSAPSTTYLKLWSCCVFLRSINFG